MKHGCLFWFIMIILFIMFGGAILTFTLVALNILAPLIIVLVIVGLIVWLVRYISDNSTTKRPSRRGRRGH